MLYLMDSTFLSCSEHMWDFVAPDDEVVDNKSTGSHSVQYRPNRMALGCSTEMIQEKISENAKKARLEKLLKRRGELDDGHVASSKKLRGESDDEDNFSRCNVASRKPIATDSVANIVSTRNEESNLSKSQKKRQKKKLKDMQKKLMN